MRLSWIDGELTKLVVNAGERCEALLDAKIHKVPVSDAQAHKSGIRGLEVWPA